MGEHYFDYMFEERYVPIAAERRYEAMYLAFYGASFRDSCGA